MIARGRVVVEAGRGGRSRLTGLRSEGPLVLRPTADANPTGVGVHLVGGAAGPLGGDVLTLEIVVGPGAELTIRTVAAAVVLPGAAPSVVEIDVRVGEGGVLRWLPEPTVAASRCDHRARARVAMASAARLAWREELVRGRYGEEGGSVSSRLAVDLDDRPLLRHQIDVGPVHDPWTSPAVGGGARCTGSLLVVDPSWADGSAAVATPGAASSVLPLDGPAAQVVALSDDAITLRRLLDEGHAALARAPTGAPPPGGLSPRSRTGPVGRT